MVDYIRRRDERCRYHLSLLSERGGRVEYGPPCLHLGLRARNPVQFYFPATRWNVNLMASLLGPWPIIPSSKLSGHLAPAPPHLNACVICAKTFNIRFGVAIEMGSLDIITFEIVSFLFHHVFNEEA